MLPILYNLGCKVNQYEGHALRAAIIPGDDLVIVNTCCVTHEAVIKSLRRLRHVRKKYPDHKVIATGCACLLYPEKFSDADRVITLAERDELIRRVYPSPSKSRYFLKIQDGCSESCTYCIVPRVRPKLASKTIPEIRTEIGWARSQGFGEVVLVGANIGLYGAERGMTLPGLINALAEIGPEPRIRLSSIEPKFLTPELIAAISRLPACRHFHIPIQSADDRILRVMGREKTRAELSQLLGLAAAAFPGAAFGADLIVGFPGEDEAAFQRTFDFIKDQPFTHLHVFPYSPRPGTAAEPFGDPVTKPEKKNRLWRLKKMIQEKNLCFRRRWLGQVLDAIVEHDTTGAISALTDNYIRVWIKGFFPFGARIKVRITAAEPQFTMGRALRR
jgi:threonylcarbamoyladenosine tRNA methylthiotransferase MtaB